jgi:predicted heme/steroid binding protein
MWYGIAVIAVTGPFLAHFRARFIPDFFTTRFGVLLLVKILAVLVLLAATCLITWHLIYYARSRYRSLVRDLDGQHSLVLSTSDLALFTGRGKRKPLFVYEGRIYDASGRDLWRKGMHPGGHSAGTDLTDQLKKAPHGLEVMGRLPVVGTLTKEPSETDRRIRLFFRAAYAGMFACFVILLVAASWRWL